MTRTQQPVTKLMRQQNPQQGQRKRQSLRQFFGMVKYPDKGDKIFRRGKGRYPVAEIPHVKRAGAGGCGGGYEKKQNGQDRLPA